MLIHQGWFTAQCTLHLLASQTFEFEICISLFITHCYNNSFKCDGKSSMTYSSALISILDIDVLAQMLFEVHVHVSCTKDFQILFSKIHNSGKGHNLDMTKYRGQLFFLRGICICNSTTLAFNAQKFQISPNSGIINRNFKILKLCMFAKIWCKVLKS